MEIIPVEIVDISEFTKMKKAVKLPEPEKDKPESPKKSQRVVEMPPPPPKMASTMPLENQKPAIKPKPPVKKVEAPSVTPRQRPKVPSRFSADRVAALLNKIEEKPQASELLAEKYKQKEQQMTSLDIRRQTMSFGAAIQKKIEDNCYNPLAGAKGEDKENVKITIYLSLDGSLERPPEIEGRNRMNSVGQEALRAKADRADRAILMCAPYNDLNLPKDKYDLWREVIINFRPLGMTS